LQLDQNFDDILGKQTKKPWTAFIDARNKHLVNYDFIDLIDKMLVYDHAERILPQEAMLHPYFQVIE